MIVGQKKCKTNAITAITAITITISHYRERVHRASCYKSHRKPENYDKADNIARYRPTQAALCAAAATPIHRKNFSDTRGNRSRNTTRANATAIHERWHANSQGWVKRAHPFWVFEMRSVKNSESVWTEFRGNGAGNSYLGATFGETRGIVGHFVPAHDSFLRDSIRSFLRYFTSLLRQIRSFKPFTDA